MIGANLMEAVTPPATGGVKSIQRTIDRKDAQHLVATHADCRRATNAGQHSDIEQLTHSALDAHPFDDIPAFDVSTAKQKWAKGQCKMLPL